MFLTCLTLLTSLDKFNELKTLINSGEKMKVRKALSIKDNFYSITVNSDFICILQTIKNKCISVLIQYF